jgi:hypothetical protein
MDEIRDAMKGYGLAVCIVLFGLAFTWYHGGAWVSAKAEAERVNAITMEGLVRDWKEFRSQVSDEHRQHSEILREITTILRGLCDEARSKNHAAQPSTSES